MLTIANRFNTLLLLLIALMAAGIITMLATRAYGGPLDPTSSPASTDGVRGPGTPISSLPFVINASGYYYVTRPLTGGPGQDGITINVSNVTVDLGGFTITGGSSPGGGIDIPGGPRNLTIRNGALRAWTYGIYAASATDSRFDNVQASSNAVGIAIGSHSEITDCNASLNTGTGIFATSGTVRNCTISENGQNGIVADESLIEDNKVQNNPMNGIRISGNGTTLRMNELSSNSTDITLDANLGVSVLIDNVYCSTSSGSPHQDIGSVSNC